MKYIKNYSVLFVLLILAGCSNNQPNNGKLKVLSSFSILSEMIEAIGGNKVEVHNLVPVGMAPHSYEPKPEDVMFATNADLIIYNGLNLEGGNKGWLMKLAKSVHFKEENIFCATDNVQPLFIRDDNGHQEENPHAFISPKVGKIMIENICNYLMQIDTVNRDYYLRNKNIYLNKLNAIEQLYTQTFQNIPKNKRVFVTSELAFQYLANDYDLIQGYIWAIDTEKNGTPQQMKNLIHFINKHRPSFLFVESNVDRRPMEIVSKSTGIPIYSKPVFSDELGRKGHSADTYLKYLQYNLDVISDGLR